MIDWSSSMQQTFEFYEVDPITWKNKNQINYIISCTINRDSTAETLGSASFDMTEEINGEIYIRVYLVTIQNGIKEKHPLGTFLAQDPSLSFDGKIKGVSVDAYTPLIELKEKQPPLGYTILKDEEKYIMDVACDLIEDNSRAIVVPCIINNSVVYENEKKIENNFVANPEDTWLKFIIDFISSAKYKLDIDEMGRIMFRPEQKIETLQPIWTYNDDNSSILQPDITIERDIYGIPNVIELIYTNGETSRYKKVINDDPNSPISTVNRGREIIKRITDPGFNGIPDETEVKIYAKNLLKELSTIEYSVTYTHGYCPVRIGDCVLFNYKRAGLNNIKGKVISQSIKCETGCQVTEKAVFTSELWR